MRFYIPETLEKTEMKDVQLALSLGFLPSVTSILGLFYPEHILTWQIKCSLEHYIQYGDKKEAIAYRDTTSLDFGTQCHELLEYYMADGVPDDIYYNPDLQIHLKTVKPLFDWVNDNVKNVVFSERSFADAELGYAGTADILVELNDGRLALLDLKCKKHSRDYPMKPSMSYLYQLSAYRNHFKKQYGDMIIGNILIAAPLGRGEKRPRLRFWDYSLTPPGDWTEGFTTAFNLWLNEYTKEVPPHTLELT